MPNDTEHTIIQRIYQAGWRGCTLPDLQRALNQVGLPTDINRTLRKLEQTKEITAQYETQIISGCHRHHEMVYRLPNRN